VYSTLRRLTWRACLLCTLSLFSPIDASAQLQQGTIHGTVVGPDGQSIDGATITLLDGLGSPLQAVASDAGQFQFMNRWKVTQSHKGSS